MPACDRFDRAFRLPCIPAPPARPAVAWLQPQLPQLVLWCSGQQSLQHPFQILLWPQPCGLLPGAPASCHTWLLRSACAGQCLPACQQLLLRLPLSLPADACIGTQMAECSVGVRNLQHCISEMQRNACTDIAQVVCGRCSGDLQPVAARRQGSFTAAVCLLHVRQGRKLQLLCPVGDACLQGLQCLCCTSAHEVPHTRVTNLLHLDMYRTWHAVHALHTKVSSRAVPEVFYLFLKTAVLLGSLCAL